MKKIKVIALSILFTSMFIGCEKDDSVDRTPKKRDYQEVYNEDIVEIENYLKTHSITVVNNPGFVDDQNVTYATVPNLDANSIWGTDPLVPKANLLSKLVTVEGVVHKAYYIKFRDGVGASPNLSNQIKAYYNFVLLNDQSTIIQTGDGSGQPLTMNQIILGWQYILPEFKMGTVTGTNQYNDYGAGVMFLPSALAYYDKAIGGPAYSPIIYNFKLFNVL